VLAGAPTQPTLVAPIILGANQPLTVQLTAMPGATDPAAAFTVRAAVLYCSARAADAVYRALGQQRWWVVAPAVVVSATVSRQLALTVQQGGRPQQTFVTTPGALGTFTLDSLLLEGQSLIDGAWTGLTGTVGIAGSGALAHWNTRGSIYRGACTDTGAAAGTDEFLVAFAGPSWEY
jgi:hypothetical protein